MSLRSALLVLVLAGLAVTEFRFDWIEGAVGAYLTTTNHDRPQSGAIWDQGRQTDQARQTLQQYTDVRQNSQQQARGATSLAQVVEGIVDQSGAMISAEHFVQLYLDLPPILANEIISPYDLMELMSQGQWQRTFFELQNQQLQIYMLDAQNQVRQRLLVGPALLSHIQRGEVAINTGLHQLNDFSGQIFSAQQFFSVLNTFPAQVRQGVIPHPEELLRISGRVLRVGISNESIAGAVDLGFEVDDINGLKVILVQGRQEYVQQVMWVLESQMHTDQSSKSQVTP